MTEGRGGGQFNARFDGGLVSSKLSFLPQLVGEWQWQPPQWMRWVRDRVARFANFLDEDPRRAFVLLLLITGVLSGIAWYWTLPTPHYVAYTVSSPLLTPYDEDGRRPALPMLVDFSESSAPLKLVGKQIAEGISLSPDLPGSWFWANDRQLRFTPRDDWPIGTEFRVTLDRRKVVDPNVTLREYSFTFSSQPFSASISDRQFYQDPIDPTLKKIVATVTFTHPVDPASFEPRVSFAAAKDAAYLGLEPNTRFFTVVYDKFNLAAHIHSGALAIPRDDTEMTLRIATGIHAARGGNDTASDLTAAVTIPGRSSLRFSGAHMSIFKPR